MKKEIAQILELAKLRVELSYQFPTIKQTTLLDAIELNQIENLTQLLNRPLTMVEQGMVLDYRLHWELVNSILNEKEEKKIQIMEEENTLLDLEQKDLEEMKKLIPIEFLDRIKKLSEPTTKEVRDKINEISDKPYSTKKEEISEPSINFDESILNEDIAPVLDQNTGEILPFEILEKISNLNFNIPVTYFTELLKERQYQIIEDIIERKLDVDELVELHTIRKLLPA